MMDTSKTAVRNIRNRLAERLQALAHAEGLGCSLVYGDGGARYGTIYPLHPRSNGDFCEYVVLDMGAAQAILDYEAEKAAGHHDAPIDEEES
jgi:hypothetical protein